MKGLKHRHSALLFVCMLLLSVILFVPDVAEAGSATIGQGQTKSYSASTGGETVTLTLTGCSNAVLRGKPNWTSVSGKTVTIQKNTSTSSRSGDVVFQNGNSGPTYTLRITQAGATPTEQKVSVRFNYNNGSGYYATRTYTVGKAYGDFPSAPSRTGYSFDGWYTSSSGGSRVYTSNTASSSTTNLYAHWSANSVTVYFNSQGGSSVSSKSVTYGSSYGSLSTPSRSYYKFDGWYTASSGGSKVTSSTTVSNSSSHTLYAHWSRQTVTVSFNNNGGSGNVPSRTYDVGSTYGSLPAGPTPPVGKKFDGWYISTTGNTKITTSTTVSAFYTTLYAHYTTNTYTVSFNSQGGSSVASKSVAYGSTYGTLTTPTRSGYNFDGWYTAASGGTKVTASTVMNTAANTTLYAHWSGRTYTVSFNSVGGSSVSSKSVTFGNTYGALTTPTRTGYTFLGWFTAASGGTQVTSSTKVTNAASHTLYAHWKGNSITVAFNNNGGYGNVPSQTYTVGSTYGSLPTGSTPPAGYKFDGWYTAASGGSKVTTSTTVSPSVTTLYAHYVAATYTVSFNSDGGSSVGSKTVTYGSTYGTLTTPTKTNYTFLGWFTASSGGTQVTASTKVTTAANHTLYAHWKANTVTVAFNNNGGYGNVPSQTYTVGSTYGSLPAGSTPPAGYTFAGWFTAKTGGTQITTGTTVSASYTTLYAHYSPKGYTVTFNSNGGSSVSNKTVTFDSTYGTLPTPTRANYNFQGWFTAASGGTQVTASTKVTTSANHTLYAHWSAKTFTITFDSQGGSAVSNKTVSYNGTYGTLTTPTRTGYTFQGWFTAKSGGTQVTASTKVTITANQTLYAQWKGAPITVKFDNNGGYGNVPSQTYVVDSTYGSLPAGSTPPAGYAFAGWYTAKSGGTKITTSTKVSPAYMTLYAHYSPKGYTVSFNSQLGSSVADLTVTYDSAYGTLPTPTRTGYNFDGWYTAAGGGTKVTSSTKVTTSANHTLYAHWVAKNFTITFNSMGGSAVSSKTVKYNSSYGTLASPTKTGYTFQGWFTAASGGTQVTASTKVKITANQTLYAQWKGAPITVKFDNNGGYGNVPSQTYVVDGTYGKLPAGSTPPAGYAFAGWYTAKTGGTKITTSTKVSPAYMTLYAHYTAKTYTVTFNSQLGSSVANKTVTFGDTYGTLTTPTRTGYNFDGWYTAGGGGTKVTSSTKVTTSANHTLYAHWVAKNFTITFNSMGGSAVSSKTVKYNSSYGTLTPPTRTGYDFQGWYTAAAGGTKITASTKVTITANQTLYAQWKGKSINVKFNSNGGYGNVPNQTYVVGNTYGSLPTGSTPPTGYVFDGWYTAASGGTKIVKTSTVSYAYTTLYAHYTAKTFYVSFDCQGGSGVVTKTVTYGKAYGTLSTPTKNNCTFQGWYTAATGGTQVTASTIVSTAANHILYARWTKTIVNVKFDSNGGYGNVPNQSYTAGEKYGSLPIGPTPPAGGYSFIGWFTAKTGGARITVNTTVSLQYTTLYAHYKANDIIIKFDINGGFGSVPSRTYTAGEKFTTLPAGPTPPSNNKKFNGWYTAKTGGTKITENSIVSSAQTTLYAQYVNNADAFFTYNTKYEAAPSAKSVPYNSDIVAAKQVGYDEYMRIFKERKGLYKSDDVNSENYMSDEDYIEDIWERSCYLLELGALGGQLGLVPEGAELLYYYFFGAGGRYEYDATNFMRTRQKARDAYHAYTNELMRQMEIYLGKGQRITFVEKDVANNDMEFTLDSPIPNVPDQFADIASALDITGYNAYVGVKGCETGVSGSCTFDGSVYKMDLYFYVEDFYKFYYKDGEGQARSKMFFVENNELAFLVPFGYATPYESCGIYHTSIEWTEGQKADLMVSFGNAPAKKSNYAKITELSK